jgi:two-component system, LuxR family, sensor kinase FixL
MSLITIIWSMVASASLTLAAVHALIWLKKRTVWADLLFSLAAVSTSGLAFCELWMMWATTPEQFGTALRWAHVPVWAIIVTLVGFARFYLRAGRPWLAWTVVIMRTLSLLLDFLTGQNLNYREIAGLRSIPFLGESVSAAEGVPNPWMILGQLSILLFVIFLVDATITVWRRGDRRQALTTGGSIALFALMATAEIALTVWGRVDWPVAMSPFFSIILVPMSYELSRDVIRGAQLAKDLLESEEQMAIAAEAAELGVWNWDIARNQVWGSERWRRLFGFEPGEDVSFQKTIQRIHRDDRDTVEREVRRALAEGIDYEGEYRVVLPGGAELWVAARGRSYSGVNKSPIRMMGTAMEITERKQDEAEMAQLRLELTHLARVMTMNEVSSSLAHEINQPLGAILNNASAAKILLGDGHEEIGEILSDIGLDARRAGDVIRRIRGMVRRSEVQLEPLQMNMLIDEVVALVHGATSMKGVSIRLDLNRDLALVKGDRIHLQQVLLNLITNALDAMTGMPSGNMTIRSTMEARDMVVVSVIDSGKGISETEKDVIFKPFFTTKRDGLGLGLPICRSIIEEHGGRIWAENNPAGGADFSFSLSAWNPLSE